MRFNSSHMWPGGQNKIKAIKAVRELSGVGLKDAKDLVETDGDWDIEIDGSLIKDAKDLLIRRLKDSGVNLIKSGVTGISFSIMEDAMQEALTERNYELAQDILDTLKKHG